MSDQDIISALLFSSLIMLIGVIMKGYILTYSGGMLLFAINYAAYILNFTDNDNILKPMNLFVISTVKQLFERYRAVNLFDSAVSYVDIVPITAGGLIVLLTATAVLLDQRLGGLSNKRLPRIRRLADKKKLKAPTAYKIKQWISVDVYELYKALSAQRQLFIILIIMVVKLGIAVADSQPKHSFVNEVYREYMEVLSGSLDDEKRSFIANERSRINSTLQNYQTMRKAYISGEIVQNAFQVFMSEYNYAYSHDVYLQDIEAHMVYIEKLEREGQEAWFLYDTGWKKLFAADFDKLLYALVVFLASAVFSQEHKNRSSEGNFSQILRTTKFGRGRTFRAKYSSAILTSATIFLI